MCACRGLGEQFEWIKCVINVGAYDNEEDAARTYDLAALKYWGPSTILNFHVILSPSLLIIFTLITLLRSMGE